MSLPAVVPPEEWRDARIRLLAQEKALTRQRDAVNAARRRLPMTRVTTEYTFTGPDGEVGLLDLFDGARQLLVYHAMFGPDWDAPCPSCAAGMDEVTPALLEHLRARETAFVHVSRAPYPKIAAASAERGWSFPWYSSYGSAFNADLGVTLDPATGSVEYNYRSVEGLGSVAENPGFSSFLRVGDDVFHTYSTYARGTELTSGGAYGFLDLTALGRQEDWEEPYGRATGGADPGFAVRVPEPAESHH